MYKRKIEFSVNGIPTEAIVSATDFIDAKKPADWQYYGQRVYVFDYTRI